MAALNLAKFCNSPNRQNKFHANFSSYTVCVCVCICNISDDPLDLLVDYFKKFGHKPCCFDDTHGYITKLLNTADADKVGVASLTLHVRML